MPSFLQYQEQARKRTKWLVLLYTLCLCSIVAVFYFIPVGTMWWAAMNGGHYVSPAEENAILWQPQILLWGVGIVGTIVGVASLGKSVQLSAGGTKVAESLGGRRVLPNTRNRAERRLLNVVEEMAIASRIAIPAVYVLDKEPGINAFAAGYSPSDASVTVTAGALEHFNREELQAVVGHEFSHILNGDMRLNIRLIATIFGIICIAVLGRIVARLGWEVIRTTRPRRSKDDNSGVAIGLGIAAIGLTVWVIGSVGVFFGRLLQATISRQREWLADASSVQFTRNPHGMAAALKVIGASANHGLVQNPKAAEISHMFFASGFAGLFATHPPLEARIARYDPGFSGDYGETHRILQRRAALRAAGAADPDEDGEDPFLRHLFRGAMFGGLGAQGAPRVTPAEESGEGRAPAGPSGDDLWPVLRDPALRDPATAPAVLLGMLLDDGDEVRAAQMRAIDGAAPDGAALGSAAIEWSVRLRPLDMRARRAACEIAVSALRTRSEADNRRLVALLDALVRADGAVTPFEMALVHAYRNRLLPPPPKPAVPSRAAATEAASAALAMIARFSSDDPAAQAAAYAAGAAALPAGILPRGGSAPAYGAVAVSFKGFEAALDTLRALPPGAKQGVMDALEKAILADGEILEAEENLLAAVADGMDAAGYATLL